MNVDDYKVGRFDQTPFLNGLELLGMPPLAGGGICAQLACKWLRLKLKELQSGETKTTQDRLNKINTYNTLGKAIERHQNDNPVAPHKSYKLQRVGGLVLPSVDAVAREATSSKHSCYLFIFNCPRYDGLHSLGMYLSSGKMLGFGMHVYVFDPDEGEYRVPLGKFAEWLAALMSQKYGAGDGVSLDELRLAA